MSNTSLLGSYGDNSGSALMFRNVLINGGFDVWQRGTTADSLQANGDAGGYGAADRWKFGGGDAATIYDHGRITQTTITTLGGFRFGVKLTAKFTSCKTATLAQFVEAANVQHLAGTQCTFSFYARKLTSSSETSNLRITVGALATTDTSGNIVNTPSAFNDSFDSGNIALSSVSTSWQRYTYTFTLSSNATRGVCVKFNVFNASNIGAFDLIEVTGTQLEAGPVATPFERRPYGTELALCQRYFYSLPSFGQLLGTGVCVGNYLFAAWGHPVTMRTTPIATFLGTDSGAWFTTSDDTTYGNYGSLTVRTIYDKQIGVRATLVSGTNGLSGIVYIQSGRSVLISAEL